MLNLFKEINNEITTHLLFFLPLDIQLIIKVIIWLIIYSAFLFIVFFGLFNLVKLLIPIVIKQPIGPMSRVTETIYFNKLGRISFNNNRYKAAIYKGNNNEIIPEESLVRVKKIINNIAYVEDEKEK